MFKAGVTYVAALAPVISVNVELFCEDCHCTAPLLPVTVMVEVPPEHIVEGEAVAVPPTETGFTTTVSAIAFTLGQAPLACTVR